jgi:DNA-binding protein HU-beta
MSHLADKIGISKKEAKLMLDELNALVVRELKKEGSIRFAGLGIFRKRKLKARVGRNPATGEQIKIPAARGCASPPPRRSRTRYWVWPPRLRRRNRSAPKRSRRSEAIAQVSTQPRCDRSASDYRFPKSRRITRTSVARQEKTGQVRST